MIYPPRTNPDGTRRRSSVMSILQGISPSTSPDGKGSSFMDLFRRKGSMSEAPSGKVEFNDVDLGGNKKGEAE